MTKTRSPYQLELGLPMPNRGEAPCRDVQEVEAVTATAEPESPAPTAHLMEAICDPDNIEAALRAVVRNKGAPGVDGITVKQLPGILKARWPEIEDQLFQGRYQPQPVRRVKIPKPAGGTRNLGIPTVIDRVIQQAVLQRLQPLWDPTFSEHSYGFRPGRSAHQAVAQAQAYVVEGYRFVVDIDLAKFFDRVNHDRLMARVAARVPDRRVLRLVRGYRRLVCSMAGCSRGAGKGPRKAVRSRPCSRTSSWMNWIASLSLAATGLCGTRMTVTSTSAAKRPAGGSWRA
jgi:RNA-directed DNA polymerase